MSASPGASGRGAARHVIGCDVGSQGTNAALFAEDGTLVAQHYESHGLSYPAPGFAEQDPEEWRAAVTAAVGALVKRASPDPVVGLSFGTQLDGMVVCDANGRALRPAMIWMDRRAEAQAAWLAERVDPAEFYRLSGANLDSSHAAFKALWVRDHEPEIFERAASLLSPGAFVLRAVTGELAVDYSNASSLALLDPRARTWSQPLLDATGIDVERLPRLAAATAPAGTVTPEFADATGMPADAVVAVGCGDEMAATLGAGVFEPGEVCDVAGTAEPVCAASDAPRSDPTMLVECHPHADPDAWLLENPGFVSGGNLRWWRDQFGQAERAAEERGEGDAYDLLLAEAATVSPGSDGLVFLPCMQGAMAPEWNGAARGSFTGLTLAHGRAHLTRALLEGSAFALRDILEAMVGAGLDVRRLTIVGGGAKGALWRRIKADVTGLPVRVPVNVETTATGAAVLAAVAAGLYGSVADATAAFVAYRPEEDEPDPRHREAYEDAYRRYRETYFAMKPTFATEGGPT
ncbi:MAG TPA: FGGY family carbohydrate kinase [Actinomycetota bacterium]